MFSYRNTVAYIKTLTWKQTSKATDLTKTVIATKHKSLSNLVYFNFKQTSKETYSKTEALYSSLPLYIDSNIRFDIPKISNLCSLNYEECFFFLLPFLHPIMAYFHLLLLCIKWNYEQQMSSAREPKPPPPRSFTASAHISTRSQSSRMWWCWFSRTSIDHCQTASQKMGLRLNIHNQQSPYNKIQTLKFHSIKLKMSA